MDSASMASPRCCAGLSAAKCLKPPRYHSHGIGKGYTGGFHEYFGPDADIDSHIYLMLANDLIHRVCPSAVTVGEDRHIQICTVFNQNITTYNKQFMYVYII